MGKNTYIIILTGITIVAILVGSRIHLGPFFTGVRNGSTKGETLLSGEAFEGIDADGMVMDLEIKTGKDFEVKYYGEERLAPEITIENGMLVMGQKETGRMRFFNFGKSIGVDVTITVPKDIILTQAVIRMDVGDIDIEGISVSDLQIDSSVGDSKIDGVSFDSLDVSSAVGDVKVISLKNGSDYSMELATDLGDVKLFGEKKKGGYNIEREGDKKIRIFSDIGDIKID